MLWNRRLVGFSGSNQDFINSGKRKFTDVKLALGTRGHGDSWCHPKRCVRITCLHLSSLLADVLRGTKKSSQKYWAQLFSGSSLDPDVKWNDQFFQSFGELLSRSCCDKPVVKYVTCFTLIFWCLLKCLARSSFPLCSHVTPLRSYLNSRNCVSKFLVPSI